MSRSPLPVPFALAALAALSAGCTVEAPACRVDPSFVNEERSNASCIIRDGERVLAIVHRFSGKFDLPGGRRNGDETGQCTAHRELWEETGLDATVGRLLIDRNSTMMFECRLPADVALGAHVAVPPWGHIEVAGIEWVDPGTVEPDDWRFPEELETLRLALDRSDN